MNRQTVFQKLITLSIILLIGLSCFAPTVMAESVKEYQLKAGFISNFLRFISWPDDVFTDNKSEIVICVVGSNPFGSALEVVAKKTVGLRKVSVIYTDSPTSIPPCHLLYVSQSMIKNLDSIIFGIGNRAIVTVSDINGFASMDGSIEFVLKNNRLSFIINNSVLKKRNITARASMLNLAALVY